MSVVGGIIRAYVVIVNRLLLQLILPQGVIVLSSPKVSIQQLTLQDPVRSLQANSTTVPTSSALCCVNVRTPVLLQTAWTTVYKTCSPNKSKEIQIIFDTRSQRSYNTEAVKNHLSLAPISTETMVIKGFGAENQGQQVCDVVMVGIMLKNEQSLEMSFLSVSIICDPVPNQSITFVCDSYD